MTLQANALVTVDQARAFMKWLDGAPPDDATVEDLVNRASDFAEWWTNRPLRARTFSNLRLAAQCGPKLRPPTPPPIDTSQPLTVSLDGRALLVWKTEADGDPALAEAVVMPDPDAPGLPSYLWGRYNWCGAGLSPLPIQLSYTGGFAPVPGQVRDAVLMTLETLWRLQDSHVADISSYTNPVTGATQFGDAFSLIPMQAKQVLDSYRVTPV